MGQGDSGALGDNVAAEQRQLHARLSLGDSVTHGRYAARHLGGAAYLAQSVLNQRGVVFVGLVCRQHVIECCDDADMGGIHELDGALVRLRTGGKAVGEVAAAELLTPGTGAGHSTNTVEVVQAQVATPMFYVGGDLGNGRVQFSCQW